MSEICTKCGLPKELCVCETIAKESQKIIVKLVKKKFNKISTVVEGIDEKEFLKAAKEGYMFPDTYLFPKDYSPEQIVKKLRNTFDEKYTDDIKSKNA